ncbi:MAG: PAS domain S-box protein [Victivallaceae bacterium]|jgi:PAS domain S-box-containing protein
MGIAGILIFLLFAAGLGCGGWFLRKAFNRLKQENKVLLHQKADRDNFLNVFSQNLQDVEDIDNVLNATAHYIAKMLEAESVCIYEIQRDYLKASGISGNFPLVHQAGSYVMTKPKYILEYLRKEKILLGEGIIGRVGKTLEPLLIKEAKNDPQLSEYSNASSIDTLMAVPMVYDGMLTGVICAVNNLNAGPFSPEQLHRLQFISAQVILVLNMIMVYRNLSEHQRITQELAEKERSELEIRQIFETSGDGMRVLNKNLEIVKVNNQFEKLTGFNRQELIGRHCYDYAVSQEQAESERRSIDSAIGEKNRIEEDVELKTADGSIPCIVATVPHYDAEGRIIGVIQNFKDISDRLLAEKSAARDAEQRGKLQMVSSVLHDIGNAVTGIGTTFVKFINEKEWPEANSLAMLQKAIEAQSSAFSQVMGEEKAEKFLQLITKLNQALAKRQNMMQDVFRKMSFGVSHISDVLSLQRAYAGSGGSANSSALILRDLVADAIAMQSASIEKRNINIHFNLPPNVIHVKADKTRIIQVLLNILKNAAESFDSSERKEDRQINISMRLDGGNAVMRFADNARGFDPGTEDSFFKNGFSTKNRGSGIGLYQCRAIVESHGGTIAINSRGIEKGAEVVLSLPAVESVNDKNLNNK